MFKALNQFFEAIAAMFRAVTNLAEAGENVTQWAKDETEFFNTKSQAERDNKLIIFQMENEQRIKDLGIEQALKDRQGKREVAKANAKPSTKAPVKPQAQPVQAE